MPEFSFLHKVISVSLECSCIIEDPEFKDILRREFEDLLVTSDLFVIKRLTEIEKVLGLNDWDNLYEDEIRVTTIPERLSRMEKRIKAISSHEV